jgi:hypothetical protein
MRRGYLLLAHCSKASNTGSAVCISRDSCRLNFNFLEHRTRRRRDCEIPIESATAPPELPYVSSSKLKEPLNKSYAGATEVFRDDMREARRSEWLTPLRKPSDKADRPESAPDSVSRSMVREGAQDTARNTVKMGRLRRACRSVEFGTCDREGERWSAQPQSGEPRPAPLHSFAGATLRGPSSCLSYG